VTVASNRILGRVRSFGCRVSRGCHDHRFAEDVNILRWLAARPPAYIGVLGPRKRTDRLIAELRAGGVAIEPRMMERLYSPVGLDLGASTPESIALSIVAEIQCLLSGRKPIHLRTARRLFMGEVIGIVLLAAGESRRMGVPKQLLDVGVFLCFDAWPKQRLPLAQRRWSWCSGACRGRRTLS